MYKQASIGGFDTTLVSSQQDILTLTATLHFLPQSQFAIQLATWPATPQTLTLANNLRCGTLSNAFLTSQYTMSTAFPSSTQSDTAS